MPSKSVGRRTGYGVVRCVAQHALSLTEGYRVLAACRCLLVCLSNMLRESTYFHRSLET